MKTLLAMWIFGLSIVGCTSINNKSATSSLIYSLVGFDAQFGTNRGVIVEQLRKNGFEEVGFSSKENLKEKEFFIDFPNITTVDTTFYILKDQLTYIDMIKYNQSLENLDYMLTRAGFVLLEEEGIPDAENTMLRYSKPYRNHYYMTWNMVVHISFDNKEEDMNNINKIYISIVDNYLLFNNT